MSIDEQLSSIEKEVFNTTKQKIDSYSLAVIRANLMANERLAQTNKELSDKIKSSIKTNNYHDLTPFSALMLRWGWGLWLSFFLIALVLCYPIYSSNQKELLELRKVIIYDSEKQEYFISSDNYKLDKEKKGITFKTEK
jgi:hypothetical protein